MLEKTSPLCLVSSSETGPGLWPVVLGPRAESECFCTPRRHPAAASYFDQPAASPPGSDKQTAAAAAPANAPHTHIINSVHIYTYPQSQYE